MLSIRPNRRPRPVFGFAGSAVAHPTFATARWCFSLPILSVLVFSVLALGVTPAMAQDGPEGSDGSPFDNLGYLQYSAGVSVAPNQNITGKGASGVGLAGRIESDAGFTIGAAVGLNAYQYKGVNLRGEISIEYREADVTGMSLAAEASGANGELSAFTAMLNGYIDFDLGIYVIPYVGAGIGYGRIDVNAENRGRAFNTAGPLGPVQSRINDEASVFAWNLMAGFTIPCTETVDLVLGYRYLATTDPTFGGRLIGPGNNGFTPRRIESQYDVHEETLGLRIKF